VDCDVVTAEAVKNSYLGIKIETNNYSLLWLANEHNKIMANVLKPGSLKNYFTTLTYIKNYLRRTYPAIDIFLRQRKYEFITGLEHYIRTTPIKANDPCTNNGTMKHLERLRKMVTWAVKNEWMEKDPFANFKLSIKKTERQYLG
jgi:Phage integrase SAM-like domain